MRERRNVLLAALALWALAVCQTPAAAVASGDRSPIELEDVALAFAVPTEGEMRFTLRAVSPNSVSAVLTDVEWELRLKDHYAGAGVARLDLPLTGPAPASVKIEAPLVLRQTTLREGAAHLDVLLRGRARFVWGTSDLWYPFQGRREVVAEGSPLFP